MTPFSLIGCEQAYLHNRLPMGTQISQQILSHCIQRSLQGCESFAISYSDNILVFSKTAEEHLTHLENKSHQSAKYKLEKICFPKQRV